MFNKIKNKLKHKLMIWLEVEQLQKEYKEYICENDIKIIGFEHGIQYNAENIKNCNNSIQ